MQSWSTRFFSSIKQVFWGVMLLILSVILLSWNEIRAVKTYKSLNEGAGAVTSVYPGDINPMYEGELIHIVDWIKVKDTLIDDEFNIKSTGVKLKREVEMYQWHQNKTDKTQSNSDNQNTVSNQYEYFEDWSGELINSSKFIVQNKYNNPKRIPYKNYTKTTQNAKIGAFHIPLNLLNNLNNFVPIELKNKHLNLPNTKISSDFIFIGDGSLNNPKIGDVRIKFSQVDAGKVSIISAQNDSTLMPYTTENGKTISLIEEGEIPAHLMFKNAQKNNAALTWALRFIGLVLIFISLNKMINPILLLTEFIPLLNKFLTLGTKIFTGILALVISLITVGLSWIIARPTIGISILVIALIGVGFTYFNTRKNTI